MAEEIKATILFEMLGKPESYLNDAINDVLDKLGKEKGVSILTKKINEPKKIEEGDLFSNFAEVEVEITEVNQLINIMFNYLPSHIEIIKPTALKISNFDLNGVCNEILRKMHEYDAIARTVLYERSMIQKKLQEMADKKEKEKEDKPEKKD